MQHTVEMVGVKGTKGAIRFKGTGPDDPSQPFYLIGTLYLRKEGAIEHLGTHPGRIRVTIETID